MTDRTTPALLGIRSSAVPAWRALQRALDGHAVPCEADPESWTGSDPDARALAALVCHDCPARQACGDFARTNKEPAGVWAGVDYTHRAGRPAQREETA